jgi:hypothetical protein
LPVGCPLAGNDVFQTADRKTFDINSAGPRVLEPLDSVGREDQIKVEGTVLELNKVLAPSDLIILSFSQLETKLMERRY